LLERYVQQGLPWGSPESSPFQKRFGLASERVSDEVLAESQFYREFMQPQGLSPEAPMLHLLSLSESWMPSGVMISRRSGKRAYPIMASPLLAAPPDAASRDAAVAVFISDPEGRHSSTVEVLRTLYELSPAASDLVQMILTGVGAIHEE
jgi:hypothetical protein